MNDLLNEYLQRIIDVKTCNLTSIKDLNKAKVLHLEDSLSALSELENAPDGPYADIGSGGGFPGVPLGIATGRQTLLVDSVKKKMDAVQAILKDLDIRNIEVSSSRIEELSIDHNHEFSVITARALSSLPTLLELASPLLAINGQLISLKSHVSEDELQWAEALKDKLGMELISKRDFYLSDGQTFRSILTFQKTREAAIKLPRKVGIAQKRPLKPE